MNDQNTPVNNSTEEKSSGDDNPGFFTRQRVCVVGLGLMGGSLALALRGKCAGLWGIDSDPHTVELALRDRVVEQASTETGELLAQADVIILAVPVKGIIRLLNNLPSLHPAPAVVIDIGSTKKQIMETMEKLPEQFDPIGGHPMCGKENAGLAYADPLLFQGAPFAFTPLQRTSAQTRRLAQQLALMVGANPLWINPEEHDRWVAATSHLPFLAANVLAAITPLEAAPMAGPGFRSTTRLATSSPQMMLEILMTNRENILCASRRFRAQLSLLEDALEQEDYVSLQNLLAEGSHQQTRIIQKPPVADSNPAEGLLQKGAVS